MNVAGYVPFGFLCALSVLRTGSSHSVWRALLRATAAGAAIAFAMETLQSYLPARIPSNVDLGLNTAGTVLGAVLAAALERLGAIAHWSRVRSQWFVEDARGGLVLLALWPFALLFPAAVTFGLGQVFERLETTISSGCSTRPSSTGCRCASSSWNRWCRPWSCCV